MRSISVPLIEGSTVVRGYELGTKEEVLSVSKEQELVFTLSEDGSFLLAFSKNGETMYRVQTHLFNKVQDKFVRQLMYILKRDV